MKKYRNWSEGYDKVGFELFFKGFFYKMQWFIQKNFMRFFGDNIKDS